MSLISRESRVIIVSYTASIVVSNDVRKKCGKIKLLLGLRRRKSNT